MNKQELIKTCRDRLDTHMTLKNVEMVIDGLLDVIMDTVAADEEVRIHGFGIFHNVKIPERTRKLPTGKTYVCPAKSAPKFKPTLHFKNVVNNNVDARADETA